MAFAVITKETTKDTPRADVIVIDNLYQPSPTGIINTWIECCFVPKTPSYRSNFIKVASFPTAIRPN